ncbi:hypothetical protein E3N88_15144 [Mikania micrantha]|uniref:Retrotransposon gag domain-containing protein n=1 Tax=Mikania micrantha TaxID=192012 RepID=A0A5N6NUT3_9ASTR|nr:hypothetical protein E3N88_15144 [Mikania micrantha]
MGNTRNNQSGSVQEYRQEFTKRSSRVSRWPDRCQLGVFLNVVNDELKAYVRIHKPKTVYNATSLALDFQVANRGIIGTNGVEYRGRFQISRRPGRD